MISTRPVRYKLEFCGQSSYATFVTTMRDKTTLSRLCYLGVEGIRMFLHVVGGVPTVEFSRKVDHTWELIRKVPRERPLDVHRMLHSSQEFERELAETFFFAYPKAEEAYYDNFPTHREVIASLRRDPTLRRVEELMYICTTDTQTSVDDADGVATIVCEDGTLCAPFDEEDGVRVLQLERAKFHPDSWAMTLFNGFFDWCHDLRAQLSCLTLMGVLRSLDEHFLRRTDNGS